MVNGDVTDALKYVGYLKGCRIKKLQRWRVVVVIHSRLGQTGSNVEMAQ